MLVLYPCFVIYMLSTRNRGILDIGLKVNGENLKRISVRKVTLLWFGSVKIAKHARVFYL